MKKTSLVLFSLAVFVFLLPAIRQTDAQGEQWLTGWSYRKKITISNANVSATLTDFPLLVKLSSDANIGTNSLSTGNDIRFTASDGATLLNYEKESWSGGGGSAATANFWVKVPSISNTSATDIYIYYGNASATDDWTDDTSTLTNCTSITNAQCVWKEGASQSFQAVWHLSESGNGTAGEYKDSTSNANNGQGGGGTAAKVPAQAAAKISNGQNFSGSNADDYIDMGAGASIVSSLNTFTVSAWVKPDTGGYRPVVGWSATASFPGLYTDWASADKPIIYLGSNNYKIFTQTPVDVGDTNFHWVSFMVTGNAQGDIANSALYADGGVQTESLYITDGAASSKTRFYLGRSENWYDFDGIIDEVRVSNVNRSAAWTKFEYNNMNSASNELAWAGQETSGGGQQTTYILTVTQDSNGTISPGTTTVNSGSNQTFTVTPNSGYQISSVTVDGGSVGAVSTYTFSNITANHTITAIFSVLPPSTYILTTSATNGTITKNPNQATYDSGTTVTLTATPNTGYTFTGWSGALTGSTNPATITMNSNKSVTANFTATSPTTYTITSSAGTGGSISPSGATAVNPGASQIYTITANSDYQINDVTTDGVSRGAITTYTFSNVTATHTISASFSAISSGGTVLTSSYTTSAATSEAAAGIFPSQWTWDPTKITNQPQPATSGTPLIKQYRDGQLIATYSTLGTGGPFDRSINNGIFRPWADGDIFEVYPAVYSGVNNQPWIGPKPDSNAEYYAGITHTPTNITIRGITVNGVRPVILNSAGASNNTLGQSVVYVDKSVNITIENIDIDGAGNNVGKAGIYLAAAQNVTFRDMRIHGFRAADGNGIFGAVGTNSGTIRLDGVVLYDNGGSGGPEHNLYINASATDPNFTVHMTNSWSYDAFYGHTFKSRAQVNILEGNYFQGGLPQSGETQAETYLVDIPNGGLLTMRNNILVKNRSGVNSNGASVSYATEGLVGGRPLGITIENNTFVAFTKYYDGSHQVYPFELFYPHEVPGSPGFPVNDVSIQRNMFVGYRSAGDPAMDYRGSLALTAGFADIDLDFSPTTNYISTDTSIIGTPVYSHAAQRGSTRQLATIGAMDFGGSAPPDTTYTITASAGAGGSISPSGATTVSSGASQIFTIAPNSGYQIASVLVDGVSQGAIATYTFTNVTAAHTISASFTATDTTPPSRSAGTASSIATTSATLQLTTDESATCKYSTTANTAYSAMTNTFSITGTTSHSTSVSGLTAGNTYTYYVRCQDTAGNPNTTDYGILFQTASPPDTTPPSAVSNLSASSISQTSLTLSWTSPGDDNNSGTASNYDIRYLTSNITTSNWSSAIQLTGEPAPSAAGTTQSYTAVGLTANTTYYFAIKTSDEVSNTSAISNIATATTTSNTCSSFTYSSWSSCQPDNTQSRTVLTSSPSGCSGGNPVLTQSCVYTPSNPTPTTCVSFTYSAYSSCQPNNTQSRTVATQSPSGCSGGSPTLTQSCSYTPSDGGGGGGGGAPVEDNIPPSSPSQFTGTLSGNYITLTWNNPTDPDFVRVVVVRKENSAPTSRTDGTAVYEGNLKEFKDTAISTNKTYYYSIYSYDTKPNYSQPAVISVSSKGTIEISTGGTGGVNPTDDTAKQIAELLAKIAQLKALIAQLLGKSFIPATFKFNNNLRYGQNSDEVKYLQLFLNQDPATKIADTGLGSTGQETIHFGRATLSAVFRFQDKYQSDIWPSPSLQKTKPGRGLVGPSTRAKINQLTGR